MRHDTRMPGHCATGSHSPAWISLSDYGTGETSSQPCFDGLHWQEEKSASVKFQTESLSA